MILSPALTPRPQSSAPPGARTPAPSAPWNARAARREQLCSPRALAGPAAPSEPSAAELAPWPCGRGRRPLLPLWAALRRSWQQRKGEPRRLQDGGVPGAAEREPCLRAPKRGIARMPDGPPGTQGSSQSCLCPNAHLGLQSRSFPPLRHGPAPTPPSFLVWEGEFTFRLRAGHPHTCPWTGSCGRFFSRPPWPCLRNGATHTCALLKASGRLEGGPADGDCGRETSCSPPFGATFEWWGSGGTRPQGAQGGP